MKSTFAGGAFGAVFGTALALHYLGAWWAVLLGMVMGGAVGWVMQDPLGFLIAFKQAASVVFSDIAKWWRSLRAEDWQAWRRGLLRKPTNQALIETTTLYVTLGTWLSVAAVAFNLFTDSVVWVFAISGTFFVVSALYCIAFFSDELFRKERELTRFYEKHPIGNRIICTLIWFNPIVFPFTLVWFHLKGAVWCILRVPRAPVFLARSIYLLSVLSCANAANNRRHAALIGATAGTFIGAGIGRVLPESAYFVIVLAGALVGGGIAVFMAALGEMLPKRFVALMKEQVRK